MLLNGVVGYRGLLGFIALALVICVFGLGCEVFVFAWWVYLALFRWYWLLAGWLCHYCCWVGGCFLFGYWCWRLCCFIWELDWLFGWFCRGMCLVARLLICLCVFGVEDCLIGWFGLGCC